MTDKQKEKIIQLRRQGSSYAEIAVALGISKNTVKSYCQRNTIDVKEQERPMPINGACPVCGKPIVALAKRKPRKFCSDACRQTWWNTHANSVNKKAVYSFVCAGCGLPFSSYGNIGRKYCSHECYIRARFKGGTAND